MEDARIRAAITRLQNGHIDGLATLVSEYQVKAVRTAYLMTADRALAEDIVQGAFIRVYERIDQFDSQRPFAPWFMRLVVNDALQAARKQQREYSLDTTLPDSDQTFAELLTAPDLSPENEAENSELRSALKAALAKLAPEQRAVIVLRYYLGLNENELADELTIPPGTVKWRLHAARKQLRGLLHRATVIETKEA